MIERLLFKKKKDNYFNKMISKIIRNQKEMKEEKIKK